MASGRIIGGYKPGTNQRIEIEWTQTGNPSAKTSTITCVVYVHHYNTDVYSDSARHDNTADCTGQSRQIWDSVLWRANGGAATQTQELSSEPIVFTVPCGNNGEHEPVTLSFRYHFGNSQWVTASAEIQLDRVPMASEISYMPASVTAGDTFSVSFRRYVTGYWHSISVKLNGTSMGGGTFQNRDTMDFETRLGWLEEMPASMTGTLTLELSTFEDALMMQQVGVTQTATAVFVCPDSADTRPAVTAGWATVAPDNAGTRAAGKNCYIAGITKLTGVFDTSKIDAKYDAQLAARSIAGDGLIASTGFGTGTSDPQIGPLINAGTKTVTLAVMDSRGLYARRSEDIVAYSWIKPKVTGMTAVRCDANGDQDELGTYIRVLATASFNQVKDTSGVNLNALTLTVQYRQVGAQSWGPEEALDPGQTKIIGGGGISTSYAYEVLVTASDVFSGTGSAREVGTATAIVPKGSVTMNFALGGDGACFGGYATQPGLEIDWENIKWAPPAGSTPSFVGGVEFKAEDANGVWHTYRVLGVIVSTP